MKIYKLNACDWWMAETREQAVEDYKKYAGMHGSPEHWENARELTEEELDRLIFHDEEWVPDHPEAPLPRRGSFQVTKRTFREQLARQVAAGDGSSFFATTEE